MPQLASMKGNRSSAGITVVELLIVMAIMGVVMAVLAAFFTQQTRVTSQTQARNEVEIKVRTVTEVIAQDLQMAGSRAVYSEGTVTYKDLAPLYCDTDITDPDWASSMSCAQTASSGVVLNLVYASSLRAGLAGFDTCRNVQYRVVGTTLQRSDVNCGTDADFHDFADNVTSIVFSAVCSDGSIPSPDTVQDCYDAAATPPVYPRQASVTVVARSDNQRENIEASMALTAFMPNLRPPVNLMGE
jgi:type II secretory pathway component PulJ